MLPFTCAKSNPDDTGGQICQGLETCVKMRSYGSAQSYYDEKVRKIDLDATPCPYCGHRHCLSLYESYPRRCRDFADADNSGGYYAIRTGCSCCSHTSAILTQLSPAYRHFSYRTILTALLSYFNGTAVDAVCDETRISRGTLYQWIHQFNKDRQLWFGHEHDDVPDLSRRFLMWLITTTSFRLFLALFFAATGRTFLQSHATPDVSSSEDPSLLKVLRASMRETLRLQAFEQLRQQMECSELWSSLMTPLQRLVRYGSALNRQIVIRIQDSCFEQMAIVRTETTAAAFVSLQVTVLWLFLRTESVPSPP